MSLAARALRKIARVVRGAIAAPPARTPEPLSAATLDLDAPAVASDPFPAYDMLRAAGPVHFLARHGAWIVLGHEELRAAFTMPQLLSNQPYEDVDAVLLGADPPSHTTIRRISTRYFSRDVIERLGAAAAKAAPLLLAKPRLDLVSEFAAPLSEMIAAQLVGFDDLTLGEARATGAHFDDFLRYVRDLRALADRATLYEALRGDELDDAQARSLVALFWVASIKTTERTIAACAFHLLTRDEVRRDLAADPSAVAGFIDEVLRLHPPEPMLRRSAKAPVDLGGRAIPPGALVYLCLAAANRDPARYEEPHTLRYDRNTAGHLAFGHGVHHCIGATLARAVVEAAVREMLREGRVLRLAQPRESLTWHASMMARFLERLEVET
jgi:cytochrome P450